MKSIIARESVSVLKMLEFLEKSKITSKVIDGKVQFAPPPPKLQAAPNLQHLQSKPPAKAMPVLTPAPQLLRKRSHSVAFEPYAVITPIPLDDSMVPLKKKIIQSHVEEAVNRRYEHFIQKLPTNINVVVQQAEKVFPRLAERRKTMTLRKPRTKVTTESYLRVANMGFCKSGKQISFKCFSIWCNFKTKTKEIFFSHLQAHHHNDTSLKSFSFCELCNSIMLVKSLEEEFIHMISFHVDNEQNEAIFVRKVTTTQPASEDSSRESTPNHKMIDSCGENEVNLRKSIDSNVTISDDLETLNPEKENETVDLNEIRYRDEIEEKLKEIFNDGSINSNLHLISTKTDKNDNEIFTFESETIETPPSMPQLDVEEEIPKTRILNSAGKFEIPENRITQPKKVDPKCNIRITAVKSLYKEEEKAAAAEKPRTKRKYTPRKKKVQEPKVKKQCKKDLIAAQHSPKTKPLQLEQRCEVRIEKLETQPQKSQPVKEKSSPDVTQKTFKRSISLQKLLSSKSIPSPPPTPPKSKRRESNEMLVKCIHDLISVEKSVNKLSPTPPLSIKSSTESSPSSSPNSTTQTSKSPVKTNSNVNKQQMKPVEMNKDQIVIKNLPQSSQTTLCSKKSLTNAEKIAKSNLKILRHKDMMPWESDHKKFRSNQKYEFVYAKMLKKYRIIALYKCMDMKCSFTSNNANKMISHLCMHDDEILKNGGNKTDGENYHLHCAYCLFKGSNSKEFMHHVNDIHGKDVYQCAYCLYRTCEKSTCLEHINNHHKHKLILIYECLGLEANENARKLCYKRLLAKRKLFVTELRCKICELGFYPLTEFLNHLDDEHKNTTEEINEVNKALEILEETFKRNAYGLYQCLYCLYGATLKDQIESHMQEHPSEFGFYCKREMPSNIGPLPPDYCNKIDSTLIVRIEKSVKVIPFTEDHSLLTSSHYKEIFDPELRGLLK